MINLRSHSLVRSSSWGRWRKPLYDSYCFSNIPGTLEGALSGRTALPQLPADVFGTALQKQYNQVIVIFFDAFGWAAFERTRNKNALLERIERDGTISCLTSMFPSTTTAHVTTLHTGLPPSQSGLYEWYEYEPLVGEVIVPLPFKAARAEEPVGLLERGFNSLDIFPFVNRYSNWEISGHPFFHFAPAYFTPSPYTNAVMQGAKMQPYHNVRAGLSDLSQLLQKPETKGLFHFYFGEYDHICHEDGPESKNAFAAATSFLNDLNELVVEPSSARGKNDRLFVVIADHGQIQMDQKEYFNFDELYQQLAPHMLKDNKGRPLLPSGSGRDLFLHIKPEQIQSTVDFLRTSLGSRAEVYPLQELIDDNLFGPARPSQRFLDRAGSVVILPTGPFSIWPDYPAFYGNANFLGHHGGLTPDEMDIVFMTLEI